MSLTRSTAVLSRTGAAAPVLLLSGALLLGAPPARAVQGKLIGDFGIGLGYDDSIYRDSSKVKSPYIPSYLGLGWRGRLTRATTGSAYYRFSNMAYSDVPRERYYEHQGVLQLKQRIAGDLSLLLDAEANLYRQPNLNRYDTNLATVRTGLEYLLLTETRLRGYFLYQAEAFPRYDLDSRGPGLELALLQDLGLYTTLRVAYRSLEKDFDERLLYANAGGAQSSTRRDDHEDNWVASLRGEWERWTLQGGYEAYRLKSNGNWIDYGPGQSAASNANTSDDTLIENFYAYREDGPFVSATYVPAPAWQLFAGARWYAITYDGRLAKTASDQFAAGRPAREDERVALRTEATRFWRLRKWTLGFTLGWRQEHSASNDSLYSFTNNHSYTLFRGWF